MSRHGERFAKRILAVEELEGFYRAAHPARYLAKRFAAKEAASKAMGTGFSLGLSLRHIRVAHEVSGRPLLVFHERALELVQELGIGAHFLSIADEADFAIAYVTLLKG